MPYDYNPDMHAVHPSAYQLGTDGQGDGRNPIVQLKYYKKYPQMLAESMLASGQNNAPRTPYADWRAFVQDATWAFCDLCSMKNYCGPDGLCFVCSKATA